MACEPAITGRRRAWWARAKNSSSSWTLSTGAAAVSGPSTELVAHVVVIMFLCARPLSHHSHCRVFIDAGASRYSPDLDHNGAADPTDPDSDGEYPATLPAPSSTAAPSKPRASPLAPRPVTVSASPSLLMIKGLTSQPHQTLKPYAPPSKPSGRGAPAQTMPAWLSLPSCGSLPWWLCAMMPLRMRTRTMPNSPISVPKPSMHNHRAAS